MSMRRPFGVPFLLFLGGLAWAGVHVAAHRAADAAGAQPGHGHHSDAGAAAYLPTSLTLCLSLALVLAAISSVYPRWRGVSGRSLWLFGAVPLLGLLAGAVADTGGSVTGIQTNLAEFLPVAGFVLIVQVAVAFSVVRIARGLLDAVAGIGALFAPLAAAPGAEPRSLFTADAVLVRASHLTHDGAPRGPPGSR